MKTLCLLRHGKSSWDDPGLTDFDRPLKRRGREASVLIGKELRRRGLRFDLVIASPAARVVETIECLEKGFGEPLQPTFTDGVYEASSRRLMDILRNAGDAADRLLLVGHNPGLQDLALSLASGNDPLRAAIAEHYPTAALAVIELRAARWDEVQSGTGQVVEYLKPRSLADQRGPRPDDRVRACR